MELTIIDDPRQQLIADACYFYQQGWMVGTAGNLSARLVDGSFWITASGKSKSKLSVDDFVCIGSDGKVKTSATNLQPSAETAIHQLLYRLFPEFPTSQSSTNLVLTFIKSIISIVSYLQK